MENHDWLTDDVLVNAYLAGSGVLAVYDGPPPSGHVVAVAMRAVLQSAEGEALRRLREELAEAREKINELTRPMSDAEYHDRAPGGWMDEARELEQRAERAEAQLAQTREALKRAEELPDMWMAQQAEYPVSTDLRAEGGAAGVRCCAKELRSALTPPAPETPKTQEPAPCPGCGRELGHEAGLVKCSFCRVKDVPSLQDLALRFHHEQDGDVACAGVECPRVQELVAFGQAVLSPRGNP